MTNRPERSRLPRARRQSLPAAWRFIDTIAVTDPSAYTDYAQDDALVAQELRAAGIDATFVGQSTDAWNEDVADGNEPDRPSSRLRRNTRLDALTHIGELLDHRRREREGVEIVPPHAAVDRVQRVGQR